MGTGLGPCPVRNDIAFILFLISDDPAFQVTFRLVRLGAAKGPVSFVYFAFAEHGGKALQSFRCLGKDGDAAHRPVQSVRDTQIDLSGLSVPLCKESLVGLGQAFVPGPVSLHEISNRFVDNKQMVVFQEDALLQEGVLGGG